MHFPILNLNLKSDCRKNPQITQGPSCRLWLSATVVLPRSQPNQTGTTLHVTRAD